MSLLSVGRARALVLTIVAVAATGCAGGGTEDPESGGQVRRVEHIWGTTEIRGTPERVVALGVTDVDPVLALGTTPVAAAGYRFFGENGTVGPWARDAVQGEEPELLPSDTEVDLEKIASLSPDLIVAISSGIDEGLYDQLTKLAPTIARPAGTAADTATRDQATSMVATALDREDEDSN